MRLTRIDFVGIASIVCLRLNSHRWKGKKKKDATLEVLGAPCEREDSCSSPCWEENGCSIYRKSVGQDRGEGVTPGGTNWASQVALAVTSPPASAGGARTGAPSLVWKIPGGGRGRLCSVLWWTGQEPGGLWSTGLHRGRRA